MSQPTPITGHNDRNRIMVIGDSISHGREGDYTWRYRLWQWFGEQNINVGFFGPFEGTEPPLKPEPPRPPRFPGEEEEIRWPRVDGGYARDVDRKFLEGGGCRHFAVGGRQAKQVRASVRDEVKRWRPNLCVIELGFNDLALGGDKPEKVVGNIKGIVEEVQQAVRENFEKEVRILVADVPRRKPYPGMGNLAERIENVDWILRKQIEGGSWGGEVRLVRLSEQYDCCNAAYDGLHPNALGEFQIARAVSRVLVEEFAIGQSPLTIPVELPSRPVPTPTNVTAVPEPSGIAVTWDAVYGAFGYDLRMRAVGTEEWEYHHTRSNRLDATLCTRGQAWEFQVRTSGGDSVKGPWSDSVSAVPDTETVPPPRNIVTHATETGLIATWDPPDLGESAGHLDRYAVIVGHEYCRNVVFVYGVRGEKVEVNSLFPGHRFYVKVKTWTSVGGGCPAEGYPVTVGRGIPPTPGDISLEAMGNTAIEISWTGHPDAAWYSIWVREQRSGWETRLQHNPGPGARPQWPYPAQSADREKFVFYTGDKMPWNLEFSVAAYNGRDGSAWSEWVSLSDHPPDVSIENTDSIVIRLLYKALDDHTN